MARDKYRRKERRRREEDGEEQVKNGVETEEKKTRRGTGIERRKYDGRNIEYE